MTGSIFGCLVFGVWGLGCVALSIPDMKHQKRNTKHLTHDSGTLFSHT